MGKLLMWGAVVVGLFVISPVFAVLVGVFAAGWTMKQASDGKRLLAQATSTDLVVKMLAAGPGKVFDACQHELSRRGALTTVDADIDAPCGA